MRLWTWLALSLALGAGMAHAADEKTLRKLEAPLAHVAQPLESNHSATVKFARIVFDLPPEPWAKLNLLRPPEEGGDVEKLASWSEGAIAIQPTAVRSLVSEQLRAANIGVDDGASVFTPESGADLQLGVRVIGLMGRFCLSCNRIGYDHRWRGAVVMEARWEIYSNLERKVVATVVTHGGYGTPKDGLEGNGERLIYEALSDNLRDLINSGDFRRVLTSGVDRPPTPTLANSTPEGPIQLIAANITRSISNAPNSVAVVFANDGSGSGFLVSDDGYLITNHHVVGASKYVKLKWPDGTETVGEVVRSDPRRDVALVKTDSKGRSALALRLTSAQQGETVFAIGTPLADQYQNTMSRGIVSALRSQQGLNYIQSDVMVNHGSSGGPLLDEKGNVIGLTVSGHQDNGVPIGLNFFIPIDDALKALSLTFAG
jgi:serine protease Do